MLTAVLPCAAAIGGFGNAVKADIRTAMNKLAIKILTAMCITIAALPGFAKGASAGGMVVTDIVVPKSPFAAARTGAAYFSIVNNGADDDALVGLTSSVAAEAMLHESKNENDVMRMRMVERLEVGAGDTIDLRKLGMHVMLVGLEAPLKAGDVVKLQLTFEKAGVVDVQAVVQ